MNRILIVLLLGLLPSVVAAAAPATAPSAPAGRSPVTVVPATQPSPAELHEQAVDAMRIVQLDVAFKLMDRAYNATPATQRSRPLVLNRAILDLTQKVYAMRAVRDVYQYLRANPRIDEEAQNILGAALNLTADTPRIKQGAVWQSAFKEWERRNDQLNESRPGYRRWGPHWLDDRQHSQLQETRVMLERAIEEAQGRTAAAKRKFDEIQAQRARLIYDRKVLRNNLGMRNPPDLTADIRVGGRNVGADRNTLDANNLQREQNLREAELGELVGLREAEARAAAQLPGAKADWDLEQRRLDTFKGYLADLRPQWPATFDPLDLSAIESPPPPPPDAKTVAAMTDLIEKENRRAKSAFGDATSRPIVAVPVTPLAPAPAAVAPATPPPAAQPATPAPSQSQPHPLELPFGPREVDTRSR